ncbi:MAG: hypothetical protein KJ727_09590 [Acidobacteria bacterium]|nr:hypothetical protein [Acidobacteriota bacterium]
MKKIGGVLFFTLIVFSFLIHAQIERKKIYVKKIESPIQLDGLFNEPEWTSAPDAGVFRHNPGTDESFITEGMSVKILYDENSVYIGFTCLDSQPDTIAATVEERDFDLRVDDSVYILIDTLKSESVYYVFVLNLLETQADARVGKSGENFDPRWNGYWEAAATKTETGWNAEIVIDLRSLGMEPSAPAIGLSLSRVLPRLSSSFWMGALDPAFNFERLTTLPILEFLESAKRLQITPFVMAKTGGDEDFTGGVDIVVLPTDTMEIELTANPEFDSIETNQELVNLTRFELRYEEKRPFMARASRSLDTEIPLFYSKRIGDIYGGVRVAGEFGGFELTGMGAQQSDSIYLTEENANINVFRLDKKEKNWSLGVLTANKLTQGRNSGSTGLDARLTLAKGLEVEGQFAYSYGEYKDGNLAFFIRPSFRTDTFYMHLGYKQLDEHFGENVNPVGFIQDDDRREIDAALVKSFMTGKGSIQEIRYESAYDMFWGKDSTLRSWQVDQGVYLETNNNFTIGVSHSEEFKLYEKEFRNRQSRILIGFNLKDEWQYVGLSVTFGKNYDATFDLMQIFKKLKITQGFWVEYDLSRLKWGREFRLLPHARDAWIHALRFTLKFSDTVNSSIHYQFHNLERFEEGRAVRDFRSNIQIIVTARLLKRILIQGGYRDYTTEFGFIRPEGDLAFLKISYLF